MAFVFSLVVFFIDHCGVGVSDKHCLLSFFSSPEQSSWRAIVLPPASALALASRPQMLKFYVKVFRASLFPKSLMDLVYICMMINTGPKFYSVPSPPPCMTLRSRSRT